MIVRPSLTIALDYDGTYDVDPEMWYLFIQMAQTLGHRVVLATYRDERHDKTELLLDLEEIIPVYYTRGVAKKWWMEQFGEHVHIWIDDKPEAILNNSSLSAEGLVKWRADQGLV